MKSMIENLSPNNEALKFIERRIADDKYRGTASSQHNRYNMSEIFKTLTILAKYTKTGPLRIRDTDTSKRPENTPDEAEYARFTEEVKKAIGQGTQDSIRKNRFPDWAVMGFIERYDQYKKPIDGLSSGSIKYVGLTKDGHDFINESNIVNRLFRYTKGVYKLNPQIAYILEILKNPDYGVDELDFWEIMFFVSAIDTETSFTITTDQCVELIKDWRSLSNLIRKTAIEKLKNSMNPKHYRGKKTSKRDFHNWKNKIEQIYSLLRENAYFHIDNRKMSLSARTDASSGEKIIKKRSKAEQEAYYREHRVAKRRDSDLHHIVALMFAENPAQYNLYDKWQNMLEVRGDKHHIVGREHRNMVFILSADGNNFILRDYSNHQMRLEYDKDINYNPALQKEMLDYNKELLSSL